MVLKGSVHWLPRHEFKWCTAGRLAEENEIYEMIVEIAKSGISCPHCDLGPLFSNYLLVNSNGNETAFNFLKFTDYRVTTLKFS